MIMWQEKTNERKRKPSLTYCHLQNNKKNDNYLNGPSLQDQ